jgi:WD40-like Beta Propeller Repeat
MSRMHRLRRRAGQSVVLHDRARSLAARRLDEPLEAADATWLADHLAGCAACRSVAAAYEADRLLLRSLRDRQPEPPRDLWARTAAAIERESAAHGGARRTTGNRRGPALGLLAGVAVIAVVIGATVLSGGYLNGPPSVAVLPPATLPPVAAVPSSTTPGPTPIAVGAGSVGWVGTDPDGKFAYNVTKVSEVCPAERQPDCAPVKDPASKQVDMQIRPKSISKSPVRNQAVVVGTNAAGDDTVLVIALPTSGPTATPASSGTPSSAPSATPIVTASPASPSPTPRSTAVGTAGPTVVPSPSISPPASSAPTATPQLTAIPTVAATLAIVSGVKIVGESAAFSPDGSWFAFTARPSDDTSGPDIYVWRVGAARAQKLTHDERSVFASWSSDRLIGSRPVGTQATDADLSAESFTLDPATGTESAMTGGTWRPVVAPDGSRAVTWDGTVRLGSDGLSIAPAKGKLVVRAFTPGVGPDGAADPGQVISDEAISEFDARWDETGSWLGIWLADASDATIGRLSLLHVDQATGKLEHVQGAPKDVTTLPGFSIANGRLAWATPPGQGGEGSRVQIVAWSDESVGAVESGPVEGVVVVH